MGYRTLIPSARSPGRGRGLLTPGTSGLIQRGPMGSCPLGRRAQKHAELAVVLEDSCGVHEANLGESGLNQPLCQALPVKSVMSVKVDLLGVEGAGGILVKVRESQPSTVDQEPCHGAQQPIQVLNVVQRQGAPHHVEGAIERVLREVCLDNAQAVAEFGRLDPLLCYLHHSGGRVRHDNGADPVGKQDAQTTSATADVERTHPRVEANGLLDGVGHRDLSLLVARSLVPSRCFLIESPAFVHAFDPSPGAAADIVHGAGRPETVPMHGAGGCWTILPNREQYPWGYIGFRFIRLPLRPRLAYSRRQLIDAVWGQTWVGDEHLVDVHVGHLRRKLADEANASRFIRTVRGIGYRMGTGE